MSDRARALVWGYYDPRRWGAPLILAIALSDEADDHGRGIVQSNGELAKKTRQTERAVRKQLRALEAAKLLECLERSSGGQGHFNHYRLHLALLINPDNPELGTGLTRNVGPGSEASTRNVGPGSGEVHINKESKDLFVPDASRDRVADDAEDRKLAEWIYARLVAMNPKHRQPAWAAWCKDLRLLRERDKRTRREIAELFQWANSDTFWQSNILSPGKLREKWEQLDLKRKANGGGRGAAGSQNDKTCSRDIRGVRCGKPGTIGKPDSTWRCEQCAEDEERARAS